MRKFLLALLTFFVFVTPLAAQQLNVGVSRRQVKDHTVADAVLMAPEVSYVILYGQATFTQIHRPELYAAGEIPVINKPHVYLGFDNGFGWMPQDKKYGTGTYFTGLTTWIPIVASFGTYGMYSYTPSQKSSTLQIGLFKQVF